MTDPVLAALSRIEKKIRRIEKTQRDLQILREWSEARADRIIGLAAKMGLAEAIAWSEQKRIARLERPTRAPGREDDHD